MAGGLWPQLTLGLYCRVSGGEGGAPSVLCAAHASACFLECPLRWATCGMGPGLPTSRREAGPAGLLQTLASGLLLALLPPPPQPPEGHLLTLRGPLGGTRVGLCQSGARRPGQSGSPASGFSTNGDSWIDGLTWALAGGLSPRLVSLDGPHCGLPAVCEALPDPRSRLSWAPRAGTSLAVAPRQAFRAAWPWEAGAQAWGAPVGEAAARSGRAARAQAEWALCPAACGCHLPPGFGFLEAGAAAGGFREAQ